MSRGGAAVVGLIAFACSGSPSPPPRPPAPSPPPVRAEATPPRPHVVVPEIAIAARPFDSIEAITMIAAAGFEELEPQAGLATGAPARALERLARDRKAAIAAQAAAVAERRRAIDAIRARGGDDAARARAIADVDRRADARAARLDARRAALTDRLRAQLDAHARELTADGLLLRAALIAERDEERWWAATDRASPGDPDPRPDFTDALAALAQVPDGASRATVRYLIALANLEAGDRAGAGRAFLDLARASPDAPLAFDAYVRAGEASYGDADAIAIEAYTWLADAKGPRADAIRGEVAYRLGRTYVRQRDPVRARARLCQAIAAGPAREDDAVAFLADDLARGGDLAPLRAACDAHACPCLAPVMPQLLADVLERDDEPDARAAIAIADAAFPARADAAAALCSLAQLDEGAGDMAAATRDRVELQTRFGASAPACPVEAPLGAADDVERAAREAKASAGVGDCYDDAWPRAPRLAGRAAFAIEVGAHGVATAARVVATSLPDDVTACVAAALRRHRWHQLDGRTVEVSFAFSPPS